MSFILVSFLIFYFAVLAFRFTVGRDKQSVWYLYGLLAASLLFYGWHVPAYVLLLIICVFTNYTAGRVLGETDKAGLRKLVFLLALGINFGLLGFFKYAGFLTNLFADMTDQVVNPDSVFAIADILLPIGISFYTLQSLSYTFDVYQRRIAPETNFASFALYVGFFPQLLAGPIVRATQFLYQWSRKRRIHGRIFTWGAYLILRGVFLKVVVADNLGYVVDRFWKQAVRPDAPEALAFSLLVFFACQLLCDFMAYTDIARGMAYQLGFRLPINFNSPYLATSFSNFWRRWHITLSQWMRDYVYASLGGNRQGLWRTCRNLIVVMLVSGLWHGAGLNFIAWGAVHAIAITLERVTGIYQHLHHNVSTKKQGLMNCLFVVWWYVVVQGTWIFSMAFFRAENLPQAWQTFANAAAGLWSILDYGLGYSHSDGLVTTAWWFITPVVAIHVRAFVTERFAIPPSIWERSIYAGIMIYAVATLYATDQRFIYFQF